MPPNTELQVSREAVEWAYRMILGRPPESEEALAGHLAHPNVAALRRVFINSPEFNRGRQQTTEAVPEDLLRVFTPWRGAVEPDSVRNFLGVRTRCAYLPEPYCGAAGTLEGLPGSEWSVLHDVREWTGLLSAVVEASGQFVMIELGAGWGPWVVSGARAAAQRGIGNIRLAAVEANPGHIARLRQHFADNGLKPEDHILLQAAAGSRDGVVRFPRFDSSSIEYGGSTLTTGEDSIEVESVSLVTLLGRMPPVDLIHIDIQGSELEVVKSGIAELNARVRRLVIGTHGRQIEAGLLDLLAESGWKLESEKACLISQQDRCWALAGDGVQVWRNASR